VRLLKIGLTLEQTDCAPQSRHALKDDSLLVPITSLLQSARDGDLSARNGLFERLYGELCQIARSRLRGAAAARGPAQLDTASLVNESYLRLLAAGELQAVDRSHFLAYAARTMRSIVVDHIRSVQADKRGGGAEDRALTTSLVESLGRPEDEVLRVHDALEELGAIDLRLQQIVDLRFFGGLTETETAAVLDISPRTVQRDWEKARLFLATALQT
jgi:RNA polymerase sigma factor (TIGR02999 family)